MLENILEKIKEFDTIIIHRHKRPDGDCIGSQFGLKYFILDNFPNKKVFAVGDEIPKYLSFVGSNDEVSDELYQDALVIVVDTSVKSRICDDRFSQGRFLIKIDHHDDSEPFGDIEYVDEKSPALCEIITQMISSWNMNISKDTAQALYTGLVTDTGRFQFRGVSEKTFMAAATLVNTGIDIEYIYTSIALKELNSFRLEAYLFRHMKITENGVVYMYYPKRIQKRFKVAPEDASALISVMSNIRGAICWVSFVEYPDNIRVRIRSRYVPVNNVASKYRGGGHLQACGATVYNKKEMKELISELDQTIKEFKENSDDPSLIQ